MKLEFFTFTVGPTKVDPREEKEGSVNTPEQGKSPRLSSSHQSPSSTMDKRSF